MNPKSRRLGFKQGDPSGTYPYVGSSMGYLCGPVHPATMRRVWCLSHWICYSWATVQTKLRFQNQMVGLGWPHHAAVQQGGKKTLVAGRNPTIFAFFDPEFRSGSRRPPESGDGGAWAWTKGVVGCCCFQAGVGSWRGGGRQRPEGSPEALHGVGPDPRVC